MSSILNSLVGTYTDSEGEEEDGGRDKMNGGEEKNSTDTASSLVDRLKEAGVSGTPGSAGSAKSTTPTRTTTTKGLVAYQDPDAGMSDEDRESVPMELESEDEDKDNLEGDKDELERSHIMEELWLEGVQLPPEPTGQCSAELQDKIEKMWNRKMGSGGRWNLNTVIQNNKAFRNPSIYSKLIDHMNIDELGTNFPPELYDGHLFGKESYYDELRKQQQVEMDKFTKATEAKKKLGDTNIKEALNSIQQRKSKWDQGASGVGPVGVVSGALAAATQAKSIPAFGVLKKK